jgi:hypothetical protein
MNRHLKIFITLLLIGITLCSCMEKETENPEEVYELWSGNEPDKEIKIINGKYWQSAHFTREYEVYLEMVTSPIWLKEFIKQNNLKTQSAQTLNLQYDAPSWFNPKLGLKAYVPSGFNQGSIYFDLKIGYVLFYEVQL